MIAFIDTHRDQFGVELICRVLRAAITGFLTSRGYRAAKTRPASDREIRDEQLIADLRTVHEKNYSCYGVLKMHRAMKRQGWQLGREQTRRLMRKAGLRGVQRGKPVFTTITDPAEQRPADLVNRQFKAAAPNRLWVADITFVRNWQGFCYTAFVTDACSRKIVGWAVAATMRTEDLPLQAFDHAVWQTNSDLSQLVHHSDRGSQYLSLVYTDRLGDSDRPLGRVAGDSYDNALAEAVNAAYKTELINRGKPWRCIDDVELATAQWVFWYNEERLHEASVMSHQPSTRPPSPAPHTLRASQPRPSQPSRNKTRGTSLEEPHMGSIPSAVRAPKRDPITDAAFNVRLAALFSRSMRASMAACTVAGTLHLGQHRCDKGSPGARRSAHRAGPTRAPSPR